MIKFEWTTTESDYKRLKNAVTTKPSWEENNFYGCVVCGNLCADFYYDECTGTAFSSGYETGDEYQTVPSRSYGIALRFDSLAFNYEESPVLDNIDITGAIENTSDFESFKKYVERDILSTLKEFPREKEKAEQPNLYWSRKEQSK